jgi:phosphoribosyl 1,2-cyclic phosphodiesterase
VLFRSVSCGGKSIFFTGDHEDYGNIYAPGDQFYDEYEEIIAERRARQADFLRGVDVLVSDCMYADDELRLKAGWGHSSPTTCARLARSAGIPRLVLTHFDPTRNDEALRLFERAAREAHQGPDLSIELAREGMVIDL